MKGIFRKIIISLFLFLLSSFVFAEELIGFNGIKFGSSKTEVEKIMIEKGWTYNSGRWINGIFGGASGCKISIRYNSDDIFYGASVEFPYMKFDESYSKIKISEIINIQKKKYDLIEDIKENEKGTLLKGLVPYENFQAYYIDQINGNYIYVLYRHNEKIDGIQTPYYCIAYYDKELQDEHLRKVEERKKQQEEELKRLREEKIKESIANDL